MTDAMLIGIPVAFLLGVIVTLLLYPKKAPKRDAKVLQEEFYVKLKVLVNTSPPEGLQEKIYRLTEAFKEYEGFDPFLALPK